MSKTTSIGSATIILAVFGLTGKAIGFFREVLFAYYFGISREYEFYLVASVLPITLNSIALYIYQNYFIPAYSKSEKLGKEFAAEFSKKNFLNAIFLAIVSLLILVLFRIPILKVYIGSNLISSKVELLFLIFCFTVPLSIIYGFLTAYSQTQFNFKSPAIASLSLNIFTIIALVIFKESSIIYIAIAYLIGVFVQTVILGKVSKIFLLFQTKYSMTFKNSKFTVPLVVWIILIEVVGQLYVLSDRYFLAKVDEGGIAAINYATTIFLLPISIFTLSITTAVMPKFSQLAVTNSKSELKEKVTSALINISLTFIPITLIFIFWGKEVIRIFYERGNFTINSTNVTYEVLFYLSFSLVFYSLYGILNKLFYVYEEVKTLFIITVLGITIKIIFNFILVETLKQNGLAISTSLSYIVFFTVSLLIIQLRLRLVDFRSISTKFIIYLLNGFFSFLIVKLLFVWLTNESLLFDIIKIILFLLLYYINNQLLKDRYQLILQNQILKFIPATYNKRKD